MANLYRNTIQDNTPDELVLAKDRHFLFQLSKKIAKETDSEQREQAQTKFDKVQRKSNQMVQKRLESLPEITLNQALPVSQQADKLVKAIEDHQVIIVAGETGSGKTTQLPKIAMLAGRGLTGQIGHTQPRRLAARSVAARISEELGELLGEGDTVSFKIRFNETGSKHSLIKLMTDGILLAELSRDRFLTNYDTLIIDEAHERSLNIDFILGYVKQLLPKRPDLKVIITSATLDTRRFSEYFVVRGKPAPVFNVEGRGYPVEVRYRPLTDEPVHSSDDDDYDDFEDNLPRAIIAAIDECDEDAQSQGHPQQADILIFAATEREIHELKDIIDDYGPRHTQVLPLYARQSYAEQRQIFSPSGTGRRIVIATNVAETALTVPNIRYVIDLGFARLSRYSYRSRVQRLPIEAISQAAANQRKGRCGRIAPGVCIRLYSEEDFESRPLFTEPEIKRTNLAAVILQMANLRLGTIDDFDFIEPPDTRLINDGRKLLDELGAITQSQSASKSLRYKERLKLTRFGRQMAKMPIDPRLSRILLAGEQFDCLQEILIIVAALAVQDARERPANKRTQADQRHAEFKQDDSDFLFYLNLWQQLFATGDNKLTDKQRRSFAKKHYLSWPRLREWQRTYKQLSEMAETLKLTYNDQPASYDNIHRALLTGLLSFIAHKLDPASGNGRGEYLAARQQKTKIFPASTCFKPAPQWIMAFEIVETSQVFMRTVAKIEPEWIISSAGDLLKYHYFEPHWSKKAGRVKAYAQISLFGIIIVAKERCNYEQVNIEESHEIFLRDALVAGRLGSQAKFLHYNLNKIAEVERIEDKLRRRDLLVDEESLYQFYASRVPAHIASRKAFEDWSREVEKDDPNHLFFTDEDVLAQHAPRHQQTKKDFPEQWRIGELSLPLKYVFDPASDDDGVIISVPVAALPQLDAVQLLWGIPGWRYELVENLLKSLPKTIRRQIVPIPDTAERLFDQLDVDSNEGLLSQLSQLLQRQGIIEATPDQFDPSSIDKHLQPQVRLLDDKNREIDKGRDIRLLQARHASDTSQPIVEEQGLHQEFPEFFQFKTRKHQAGVAMMEYQALVSDRQQSGVTIHYFTDEIAAQSAHRHGVLTLIKLRLGSRAKQLTKQVDKPFKMAFAPLGQQDLLNRIIIDATLDAALSHALTGETQQPSNENETLPLSQTAYKKVESQVLQSFLLIGQDVLPMLRELYLRWQRIRQSMLMLDQNVFKDSIQDIEDQLEDLHLSDFIYRMDYAHWQRYPRYLEAIEVRLERLPHNLESDLEGVFALDVHMERLGGRADDPQISDYRWLVEEYRIQLFAQPMKTLQPVSEKRLNKLWDSSRH